MALDRETIEKKDFPVGRRGYDPSAVDAHLRALADEVDELKRSSRQRTETLAATASDQVRAIIEAAESSGGEIRRQAEEESREIKSDAKREAKREREEAARAAQTEREQASSEAQRERDEALGQSREYVNRVSESTSGMLTRLEAMETELGSLTESLRAGATRLTAELEKVESEMSDLTSAAPGRSAAAIVAGAPMEELPLPAAAEPVADDTDEEEPETAAAEAEPMTEAETAPTEAEKPDAEEQPSGGGAEPGAAGDGNDTEGARLIALNMALNGTPRDETDRYLAENFEIPNRDRLLDEVYASVEG